MGFNISCSIFLRASARPLRNPATNHGSGCFVSVLVSLGNRPFAMEYHAITLQLGEFSFIFYFIIFLVFFSLPLNLKPLAALLTSDRNSMTGGELIYIQ
ncbi:hypothetical protein BDV24DRAFT_132912 [Aspergillus arachidicola]|uniref:Uncharacterized protein n=1 Tax=Aspergillus arachidicola TaxID=656916 RepID=A0A5N6Y6Q7_9EURO|nr:hypothetical protein BDV24DRAFT_132912 [Aspergillus arachidicola]